MQDLPTPVAFAKMDDGDEANRALRAGSDEMYNYSSYPTLMLFRCGRPKRSHLVGRRARARPGPAFSA